MIAASSLRVTAVTAVGTLLIAGLVTIAPAIAPEAAAAVTPPDGSETFQVSQSDAGSSTEPYLTSDGQHVVFTSTSSDLVTGDVNGFADVFASVAEPGSDDPFSGAPTLVSVPDETVDADQADGPSGEPVASADGRYVAFTSVASNLVPWLTTAGRKSVYVRDTLLGKTIRVERGGFGEPDGDSYDPDLSDDGKYLVFTSEATNLTSDDTNGVRDAFLANLDWDADGIMGDLQVIRFIGDRSIPGGTEQARISGNGASVVFTAHQDTLSPGVPPTATSGDFVFHAARQEMPSYAYLVGTNAHHASIDATGDTFAFIDDDGCDAEPAVIAGTLDSSYYFVALGTIFTDRRVGYVADPEISADGSHVAWTTTVPPYDFVTPAAELPAPVVRLQPIGWWDSQLDVQCAGITGTDWFDLAEGAEVAVSASARTVAYSAPAIASRAVFAMDRHSHDGLSVSSTQGQLTTPGFMTSVEISAIPLASLRGYASAIANAPIHRLPIHRLPIHRLPIHRLPIHRLLIEDSPIHRLPIHRLPIHRLPIHRLDIPGGWDQLLADTPFAGELVQSVTLDEVLAWATATLADGSPATDAERTAALLIQSLTLGDLGLDGSGLDALTLASYVLGAASVAEVPIGGSGTFAERWQVLVDAQGLGIPVVNDENEIYFLADLDAAGLDVERTGIDAVPLASLPIDSTMLGYLLMSDLFLAGTPLGDLDVSTLDGATRIALFGSDDVTGTLASLAGSFLLDATAADLAAGAPDSVTVGLLLLSMLDRETYPWEQIAPASLDPNLAESTTDQGACDGHVRCARKAFFTYTFDPGPGEPTIFAAPTASLTTPAGTAPTFQYLSGSGPDGPIGESFSYAGPKQVDGERMRIPLSETAGGTVLAIESYYTATTMPGKSQATGELTSGSLTASDVLFGEVPLASFDDPLHNMVDGQWEISGTMLVTPQVHYEWISPQWRDLNDEGDTVEGPAQDEDFYLVMPPLPGKRLVVSTNATDGQLSLSLYAPQLSASALGVENAGVAPGTPVTEQSGPDGQPAEAGADAGTEVANQTLVDQAVVGGDGTAQVEAASTDVAGGQNLLVRVTSGNGEPSASLYSLRVQYLDEAPEVRCMPSEPAQAADPGVVGVSDAVTAATNTIYLFDQKRYGDTYGAQAAASVRAGLESLTGKGQVGDGAVNGAVLAIDSDLAVQTARLALDANPCSMQQRGALTSAINAFVKQQLGVDRAGISSVVIVGGDDMIPFAPVAQHTSQFTEVSHAADLRLPRTPAGDPCPVDPFADPCETPLSAAAATSHILTDDPYGLAKAYQSLGGFLYVPTVALGRLVESPEQIMATIDRFTLAQGVLAADSTLTGGYGAWSELPQAVTEGLAWRSAVNSDLGDLWDAEDLQGALFPAVGDTPRVVSVNTHADETRMLPGVPGAPSGSFADGDLFGATGNENQAQLAGSLIFGIGCHAGNNLPTAYYGDVTDWADVFSAAGGYVGNTGYGLANSVTTALGERLLALYADWIGVSVDGAAVSSAGALTYAKQSYLGGLGLYSGYDEKVLMEAVYYGLPMYSFSEATKEAPLPETPDLVPATIGGLTTAGLNFQPTFETHFVTDDQGDEVEYLTVAGQPALASPGQPVLASIVKSLPAAPTGKVARGVLLTSLSTTIDSTGIPAVTAPGVGIPETNATRPDSAFPSTFATLSHQQTPTGTVDLMVITPSRVQTTQGGAGITERFTDFRAEVVYGDDTTTDTTAPAITAIEVPGPGRGMSIHASDKNGIAAVVLLVQPETATGAWQRVAVDAPSAADPTDGWDAEVPDVPFRWIVQVVDGAGNVATDTARGRLPIAGAPAPSLDGAGPDVTLAVGERLLRAVPVSDAQGYDVSASVTVTAAGGEVVSTSPVTVETGPDGTTRALIDQTLTRSGIFTVKLSVCRGDACSKASFQVDIPEPNARPAVEVTLESDEVLADPTSTLTAKATPDDPEGDAVTFSYAWTRNGVVIPEQEGAVLELDGIAQPDDIIGVTVTPADAGGIGHSASAELLIHQDIVIPPAPTITATATMTDGTPYVEGTWSTGEVTVSFECTWSAPLLQPCPEAQVLTETGPSGVTVTGTVTDEHGGAATAEVLVKVDGAPPTLAPAIFPQPITVGTPAIAIPNATDASSGVASQSCETPQTSVAGPSSVICTATDTAGNSRTVAFSYTVQPLPAATCRGRIDRTELPPLNADGSSVFLRTSGVPIVFTACDAQGNPISTKKFVKGVTLVSTASLPARTVNELWYPPVQPFKFVKPLGVWVGNIATAKLAGGKKYTYRVDLADGTSFTVTFGVR